MTIICDLDDTLVRHGVQPNIPLIKRLNTMGEPVVIVTGRPEAERDTTKATLIRIGVRYSRLLMNSGPADKLDQIKSKTANARTVGGVTLAIDNDPMMRAAYKTLGFRALDPKEIV